MIIVSQNKGVIVNFNQIECIDIRKNFEGIENYFSLVTLKGNNKVCLASYKTEERAKEVLEKIIAFYEYKRVYECSEHRVSFTKVFVYEMPLE